MKAQVEIKLNLPHANKMLFDVDITHGELGYEASVYIERWDNNLMGHKGIGENIDEAVSELLKKMDFYNKPGV